ncbi:MAG: LuxR C-terminal-related transcriptional regulator [Gemmatimonadota bacterium]
MIRIFIVDDDPIAREGLRRIVSAWPDMRVVGEAAIADEVLAERRFETVDVLLLDVSRPNPTIFGTMSRLASERPRLRLLVIRAPPQIDYAVRSLRAGAAGYLTTDRSPLELAHAIRRVHRGGKYVTGWLGERLAFELALDGTRSPHEALSRREYEVMSMLASGRTVGEIAKQLSLSPKTVSSHKSRILRKMKLRNNAELVRYAVENKLM